MVQILNKQQMYSLGFIQYCSSRNSLGWAF